MDTQLLYIQTMACSFSNKRGSNYTKTEVKPQRHHAASQRCSKSLQGDTLPHRHTKGTHHHTATQRGHTTTPPHKGDTPPHCHTKGTHRHTKRTHRHTSTQRGHTATPPHKGDTPPHLHTKGTHRHTSTHTTLAKRPRMSNGGRA